MALLVVLICAGTCFDLEIPGYMSEVTVRIQPGDMDPVVHDGLMMVGCTVMSLVAMVAASAITTYVATSSPGASAGGTRSAGRSDWTTS